MSSIRLKSHTQQLLVQCIDWNMGWTDTLLTVFTDHTADRKQVQLQASTLICWKVDKTLHLTTYQSHFLAGSWCLTKWHLITSFKVVQQKQIKDLLQLHQFHPFLSFFFFFRLTHGDTASRQYICIGVYIYNNMYVSVLACNHSACD